MASAFAYYSLLLLSALFVLQCIDVRSAGIAVKEQRIYGAQKVTVDTDHPKTNKPNIDPSYNVFVTPKDLYKGYTMPVYFFKKDPYNSTHLLPGEAAHSIPFSLSVSFAKDPIQHALRQCKLKPKGKIMKFCVSSLESMREQTQKLLGSNTKLHVFNSVTDHLSKTTPLLQNYTFLEAPHELPDHKMVACHPIPHPYAMYYCHGHVVAGVAKVYSVPIGGENGERVEAVIVCHMSTAGWDEDHVSFKMLNMKPRSGPVCHFVPPNNFVWLPLV